MNERTDTPSDGTPFDPFVPSMLFDAFAAAGRAGAVDALRPVVRGLPGNPRVDAPPPWVQWLVDHAHALDPLPDPSRRDNALRWLSHVADVAHARAAAVALVPSVPGASALVEALDAILVAAGTAVRAAPDRWWAAGSVAADRGARDEIPWSWVSPSIASPLVDERLRGDIVHGWIDGWLHPADAASLRDAVRADSPWRESYRAALADRLRDVPWEPSLRDLAPTDPVRLATVALPHLGPAAPLEGSDVDDLRSLWAWPGGSAERSGRRFNLEVDAVTGTIPVSLDVRTPSPRATLWRAVAAAHAAAASDVPAVRAEALARAVCARLRSPPWRDLLAEGARCFREGVDAPDEVLRAIDQAVDARAALVVCEEATESPALREALDQVDDTLDGARDAVMLLDADRYDELVSPVAPSGGSWWEWRAVERIDETVEALGTTLPRPSATADVTTESPAWKLAPWAGAVVVVDFQRPPAPAARFALASAEARKPYDDPGRDGAVVYSDREIKIQVQELPSQDGVRSHTCVRVELAIASGGDLGTPGAVVVRAVGVEAPLPLVGEPIVRPLLWWAEIATGEDFSIEVTIAGREESVVVPLRVRPVSQ